MKTVGAYEAKTHLSRLLNEVANGETITITRHGVPVARLTPVDGTAKIDLRNAVEEWREYRRRHNITLGGIPLKELIEEGRR